MRRRRMVQSALEVLSTSEKSREKIKPGNPLGLGKLAQMRGVGTTPAGSRATQIRGTRIWFQEVESFLEGGLIAGRGPAN